MKRNRHRVWAPRAEQVELLLVPQAEHLEMRVTGGGWFEVTDPRIVAGQCYAHVLDGGDPRPDPRSQYQPQGVHDASCWVNLDDFTWTDDEFRQCPLASALIYELHVGTFTPEGTFTSIIEHLPHLQALGVTHIELMPVAHFPTTRGWGYDGVSLFAPHPAYGGPTGLQQLVDACHRAGIAVLLDVVYNHLGPSGNYLSSYGPYFTSSHRTPWGEALNFDQAGSHEVRRYICDNALHWLRNYHIDGLRLDAVHAIFDQSAIHILQQLAQEVDQLAAHLGRNLVLIAESDLNDPRFVRQPPAGHGLHAQWSDDFHHALHAALTDETRGYYADFGSLADLATALRYGFVYRGQYSAFRDRRFGAEPVDLRGRQYVVFAQNHDQIGNRAVGDRLTQSLDQGQLCIAAALTLLSPFVPQLFMGEEWGSRTPFQYFTDHAEPELAEAIRNGRRAEFAAFGWDADEVPDPQSEATFLRSKLTWNDLSQGHHRELLEFHRALVRLRRSEPAFADDRLDASRVEFDEERRWLTLRRGAFVVACNFASRAREVPLGERTQRLHLASHAEVDVQGEMTTLPPHGCAVIELRGVD